MATDTTEAKSGSGTVSAATADTMIKPLFRALDASNVEELETSELESLCIQCEEKGITRLLLTKIPMFRDVIVMSFNCPHCGYSNNEIQEGSPIQDNGIRYTITVNKQQDLDRLVVKADSSSLKIPSLDFEIPPATQRGSINTLEGFIRMSIEELEQDQPARQLLNQELAEKLDVFIALLKDCLDVQKPFTVLIDDPSGNSFVENKADTPHQSDPDLVIEKYTRTEDQDKQLGIVSATEGQSSNETESNENVVEESSSNVSRDEVLSFSINCPTCNMPATSNMKLIDIPHFKEMIIMALICEYCGHKSNEVKSGSGISETGKRIELHLTDPTDLSRDILKAETASLAIPELEFELKSGTLGGRFTTVEGLLSDVKAQLSGSNPFAIGDSATGNKLMEFLDRLQEIIEGKRLDVHIILDDPAGNSYLQNVYAPDDDPEMKVVHYERTYEQNEELGLNDMKTENY